VSEIPEIPEPPTFTMEPVPGRPGVVRPVLSRPIQPWIGDPPKECPECAELGHTSCWEAAYRAGREDAAQTPLAEIRSLAAFVAKQLDAPTFALRLVLTHVDGRLREIAADLATGDGVQPTEEQRARDEDQKRDDEQRP
jgi:hypothetical protein